MTEPKSLERSDVEDLRKRLSEELLNTPAYSPENLLDPTELKRYVDSMDDESVIAVSMLVADKEAWGKSRFSQFQRNVATMRLTQAEANHLLRMEEGGVAGLYSFLRHFCLTKILGEEPKTIDDCLRMQLENAKELTSDAESHSAYAYALLEDFEKKRMGKQKQRVLNQLGQEQSARDLQRKFGLYAETLETLSTRKGGLTLYQFEELAGLAIRLETQIAKTRFHNSLTQQEMQLTLQEIQYYSGLQRQLHTAIYHGTAIAQKGKHLVQVLQDAYDAQVGILTQHEIASKLHEQIGYAGQTVQQIVELSVPALENIIALHRNPSFTNLTSGTGAQYAVPEASAMKEGSTDGHVLSPDLMERLAPSILAGQRTGTQDGTQDGAFAQAVQHRGNRRSRYAT